MCMVFFNPKDLIDVNYAIKAEIEFKQRQKPNPQAHNSYERI